jgi:hypothetical protein
MPSNTAGGKTLRWSERVFSSPSALRRNGELNRETGSAFQDPPHKQAQIQTAHPRHCEWGMKSREMLYPAA